jgi:APA family basic amino acid/polyamine antiporter
MHQVLDAARPAPRVAPPEGIRLLRAFGIGFGIAVAVGGTIGAGILRTPSEVASLLPTPALFVAAWITGGIYALLGANAIAELGAMIPRSGGQFVFARRALGPYAGFVVGWNDWLSCAGSVAAISIVIGEAVVALAPALAGRASAVAVAVVAASTLLLWRDVRTADRSQRAASLVKAIVLLALVAACLAYAAARGGAETPPVPPPTGWALLGAFVLALQGVIYTYDGWTGVIYFSEEVRDPGRDIPRALFGGVLAVMALYLLVNAAFLAVVPLPEMARSALPAATAATAVFGAHGATVIHWLVALALPSAVLANLQMGSRVAFALGREGAAPGSLTTVRRGGTPASALLVTAVVVALFVVTGTFERVIALCAFLFVASYSVSFAAVFVLRRREPDAPRPYRARGHPLTTALALAGSLAFLVGVVVADPRGGLASLLLVALSVPIYLVVRRRA